MKPEFYETADFGEEKQPEYHALFLSYFLYKKYGLLRKLMQKYLNFTTALCFKTSKLLFICEATKG